jgi:hypothetical protein
VVDEQEEHARAEQEEDELGECVGGPGVSQRVHDGGHDQE